MTASSSGGVPTPTPQDQRDWDRLRELIERELTMWTGDTDIAEGARIGLSGALTFMDAIANREVNP